MFRTCIPLLRKYAPALALVMFPAFSTTLYAQISGLVINEFLASNSSVNADEYGEYDDWVEIWNADTVAVDLGGLFISDDDEDPLAWQIASNRPDLTLLQPGAFLVLWCDRQMEQGPLHVDIKLSADGEDILLSGSDNGNVYRIDGLEFGPQTTDVSYGRYPDGGENWVKMFTPTPGSANLYSPPQLAMPSLSAAAGFYEHDITLMAVPAGSGEILRYTLDGSLPDSASPVFSSPILIGDRTSDPNLLCMIPPNHVQWGPSIFYPPQAPIFKGTVVRVRAFREGYTPSAAVTGSYFVGENAVERYDLPVVSISTDMENLFDDSLGIYVPGISYRDGDDFSGNYFMRGDEWERPVHFEYFNSEGRRMLSEDAGVRIHGGATRVEPMKSLRLYAQSEFLYEFFPGKDIRSYKRLLLRNSGNDRVSTMFRDILMTSLAADMDSGLEYQAASASVLFINGEYWGIHNLRERVDKYFLADNFPADPDELDLLEMHGTVSEGSADNYWEWFNFLESADMTSAENYRILSTYINMDNFRDYNIAQIYFANVDWPANNRDYWRPHAGDTRWRWIAFDTDFGFGFQTYSDFDRNTLEFATTPDAPTSPPVWPSNLPWSNVQLRKMLQNPTFRHSFINRFADMLNTVFSPDHVLDRIDSLEHVYEKTMPEHIARWSLPASVQDWHANVDVMERFALLRPGFMRLHLRRYFNETEVLAEDLDTLYTLKLSLEGAGHIDLNTITVRDSAWQGIYFHNIPVTLEALPDEGQRFIRWTLNDGAATVNRFESVISIDPAGDIGITAVFVDENAAGTEVVSAHDFRLYPPFPNPFNNSVTFKFTVVMSGPSNLDIYSLKGEKLASLVGSGNLIAGTHNIIWNGRTSRGTELPSGIYLAVLKSGQNTSVQRILLIK